MSHNSTSYVFQPLRPLTHNGVLLPPTYSQAQNLKNITSPDNQSSPITFVSPSITPIPSPRSGSSSSSFSSSCVGPYCSTPSYSPPPSGVYRGSVAPCNPNYGRQYGN